MYRHHPVTFWLTSLQGFLATPSVNDPIPLTPGLQYHTSYAGVAAANPDDPSATMSTPASSPPLPSLSHLRAAKPLGPNTKLPDDFHNRCIWEVLSEGGLKATDEPVTYGSMIRLRHTKTGFLIMVDALSMSTTTSMAVPGAARNYNNYAMAPGAASPLTGALQRSVR